MGRSVGADVAAPAASTAAVSASGAVRFNGGRWRFFIIKRFGGGAHDPAR
jgi:hypothetical protein